MFSSGLITFRETLEAALVVGVILSYLSRLNQHSFKKFVWFGVLSGIGISLILAVLLELFLGGLKGKTEELFEGILMLVTAGFLTWMILWIHRQKDIIKNMKQKVVQHVEKGYGLGIFFLIATSVFREGTETVLYIKAMSLTGVNNQFLGAVIGIIAALGIGYGIFILAMKVNLEKVFNVTGIFLLLFAAGLVAHGVHEFQEVGFLPVFSFDPIFNISSFLDHKSTIGSILRTLFGYTSKPTLFELFSYGIYIFLITRIEKIADKKVMNLQKH